MGISRLQLKLQAKKTIQETKPSPILISVLYAGILLLFSFLQNRLLGIGNINYGKYLSMLEEAVSTEQMYRIMEQLYQHFDFSVQATLLRIVIRAISLLITAGFSIYCLRISRKIPSGAGTLFDGFGMILKIFALTICQILFITLWTLCFFVPGIIAAYSYRQALYLLLDHPDWSPLQCLRASKEMMRGRRMELFVLDLSFLLWALCTGIPYLGVLVSIWLYIYQELTMVNYYNSLLENPFYQHDQDGNAYWDNHE